MGSEQNIKPGIMNGSRNGNFRKKVQWAYETAYGEIWGPGTFYPEEKVTPAMEKYYREFSEEVGSVSRCVDRKEIVNTIKCSDLVYISDFHPLRVAKEEFLMLLDKGRNPDKNTVVLLEEFKIAHQQYLDAYITGEMDADLLKKKTQKIRGNGKPSWQGLVSILGYVKENSIDIYGLETNRRGLNERDRIWSRIYRNKWIEIPNSQIFSLIGEMHLGGKHLPYLVSKLLPETKSTIVFQGLPEIFWNLMELGLAGAEAVQIAPNVFNLNNFSPLMRALVYQRTELNQREVCSSTDILGYYNSILNDILKEALGTNGNQDLNQIPIEKLESLVHANFNRRKTLAEYKKLIKMGSD